MIRRALTTWFSIIFALAIFAGPATAYGTGAYDRADRIDYDRYGVNATMSVWNYVLIQNEDFIHTHCQVRTGSPNNVNTRIRQCRIEKFNADGVLLESKSRGQTSQVTGNNDLDSGSIDLLYSACHKSGGGVSGKYFIGTMVYDITFFPSLDGNTNKVVRTTRTYCNEIYH